jgi:hypothetical protein
MIEWIECRCYVLNLRKCEPYINNPLSEQQVNNVLNVVDSIFGLFKRKKK